MRNRVIKFRAYDAKNKYMAYQGTPDLETIQSFFYHFGDCELMQFTGLYDKNGKEVYEGDILMTENSLVRIIDNSKVDNPEYLNWYEVFWNENKGLNCWSLKIIKTTRSGNFGLNNRSNSYLNIYTDTSEIVGNIFENQIS